MEKHRIYRGEAGSVLGEGGAGVVEASEGKMEP